MPKFTFICEHESEEGYGGRTNTVDFQAESWDEVVAEMTDFLHGCGYVFKGELQMVQPETTDPYQHTKSFFDTSRNR